MIRVNEGALCIVRVVISIAFGVSPVDDSAAALKIMGVLLPFR